MSIADNSFRHLKRSVYWTFAMFNWKTRFKIEGNTPPLPPLGLLRMSKPISWICLNITKSLLFNQDSVKQRRSISSSSISSGTESILLQKDLALKIPTVIKLLTTSSCAAGIGLRLTLCFLNCNRS